MNLRRAAFRPRSLGILLRLCLPLLALCACGLTLDSAGRGEAQVAHEPIQSEPVLVRIAACSTGLPLANDLIAACPTGDSHLLFDLVPTNSQIALELVLAGQADLAIVGIEVAPDILSGENAGGRGFDSEGI